MILRRVIAHFRKQEWTVIALDFLIVFVGVFVGIQAANWNEMRLDRMRADNYLERMQGDFEKIRIRLNDNIAAFDNALVSIEHIRNEIDRRPSLTAKQENDFRDALNQIDASSIPAWRSATYVEMQSAGVLDLIDHAGLKQALVNYDQGTTIAQTAWGTLIDRQTGFVEPILFSLIEYGPRVDVAKGTDVINVLHFDYDRMRNEGDFKTALSALARTQSNNRVLQANQLVLANKVITAFAKSPDE